MSGTNDVCPKCGTPCYHGLTKVECTNDSCPHFSKQLYQSLLGKEEEVEQESQEEITKPMDLKITYHSLDDWDGGFFVIRSVADVERLVQRVRGCA